MTDHQPLSVPPESSGAAPPAYQAHEAEVLLRQAIELVDAARPMPLSSSSMINRDEVLSILMAVVQALPAELRAARWLLKERDEFLKRVQAEGDRLISDSRTRAERMIERTELVRTARQRAEQLVSEAEDRARRLKLETEDWCDRKLGAMAAVLDHTLTTVETGRARLQGVAPEPAEAAPEQQPPEGFFDQDEG